MSRRAEGLPPDIPCTGPAGHCNGNMMFYTVVERDRHVRKEHRNIPLSTERFQCTSCSVTSYNDVAHAKHEKSHTVVKAFGCYVCAFRDQTQLGIDLHVKASHGEKKFCCSECSFEISYD